MLRAPAANPSAQPQRKALLPQGLGQRKEEERNCRNLKVTGKQQAWFPVALGFWTIHSLGNCPAEPDLAPGSLEGEAGMGEVGQSLELG